MADSGTSGGRPAGSDELLRLLVESVGDYAIFTIDPDGCVTTWNLGAERIKGYTADEIVGESFERFYTPEAVAAGHPEEELAIARDRGRYEEEGIRVRKDGTEFPANVVITALRDESGELRGFAKVMRDLTADKEAEQRLMEARAELERRAISESAALRIHDDIVQGLITARYAAEQGMKEQERQALDLTLDRARDIIDRLLGETAIEPGQLRRNNSPGAGDER